MPLAEAGTEDSWSATAWTYRRAIDDVYTRLAHETRRTRGVAAR